MTCSRPQLDAPRRCPKCRYTTTDFSEKSGYCRTCSSGHYRFERQGIRPPLRQLDEERFCASCCTYTTDFTPVPPSCRSCQRAYRATRAVYAKLSQRAKHLACLDGTDITSACHPEKSLNHLIEEWTHVRAAVTCEACIAALEGPSQLGDTPPIDPVEAMLFKPAKCTA